MEPELEKLISKKRFCQLSQNEKKSVLDTMTEVEYERFRIFLILSKISFDDYNVKIDPNPRIKYRLRDAYQQKFNKKIIRRVSSENKEFKKPVFKRVLTYAPFAGFVILAAILFLEVMHRAFVMPNTPTTEIDIHQIENFELLQEQMSLNDIGLYSEITVPESQMDLRGERPDTLLIP